MKKLTEFINDMVSTPGIMPRANMPQFEDGEQNDFEAFLRDRDINHSYEWVPANQMKPMQSHYDANKVKDFTQNVIDGDHPNWEFFTSKDLQILDGNHRWAAVKGRDPNTMLFVIRVNASFPELVSLAHEYKAGRANK